MAFQARNANYNALRKLSLREKLDAVVDPRMGQTLISMLTPTQAAELFPKYYYNKNPDISGFLKAIPTSLSAARQKEYEQQIENTASGSSAGANYQAGGYRKKWQEEVEKEQQRSQITRITQTPLPQLSPEQKQAFEALKAGDIGVDDDRVKFLKNISDADLTRAGLTRIKDDKGDSKYHYTAPQISESQVKENLISSGSGKFSGKENAVLSMISRREGATHPDTVFGDPKGAPGQGPYARALGLDVKPLSQRSIAEVLELQKRLTAMTAARGVANGQGTSAVGSGQFVRGTLIENLRRLGIPESEWDKIKYDHDLQKRITLSNFRAYVGDPNGDPSNWNLYRLGKQWESFDTSKGFAHIKTSEIESVRNASSSKPSDPLTQNYSPQQLEAKKRELQSQMEAGRLGELAAMTQPGGPVNAAGSTAVIGEQNANKWSSLNLYKGGSGHGMCARGVIQLTKQLYAGNKFFDGQGITNHGDAYQHMNGSFFTSSGLFNSSRPMTEEEIKAAKENPPRLPPGSVVVMGGGKNGHIGHIQILGNGRWMSDHMQKRFYAPGEGGGAGRTPWNNAHIIIPNQAGQQVLAKNGFITQPSGDTSVNQMPNVKAEVTYKSPNQEEQYNPPPEDMNQTAPQITAQSTDDIKSLSSVTQPEGPVNAAGPVAKTSLIAAGTNDWGDESSAYAGVKRMIESAKAKGENPVLVLPNKTVRGTSNAYNGAMRAAKEYGITTEYPSSFDKDGIHLSSNAAKELKQKYPGASAYGDSNSVRLGAQEGVTGFTGKSSGYIADKLGGQSAPPQVEPVQQTAAPQAAPEPKTAPTAAPQAAPEPQTAAPQAAPEPKTAPQAAPTAAVEAPKPAAQPAAPTPERYNVNIDKFTNTIRQTQEFKDKAGMFGSMVPNSTIINGFNDDPRVKSAGVHIDEKGVMHFTKGMTPEAKQTMADFDTKSFMTKIEDKKKEENKPTTKVKAMAEGGKVPINTEEIRAYPINALQGDNTVVVNAHQKPLFTMNTNENIMMDPDNNRAEVIPDKKGTTVGPKNTQDMSSGMMEDFNSTIQEIKQDFANLKAAKVEPRPEPSPPIFQQHNWLEKSTYGSAEPYKSPATRRVAYRSHGMETGEVSSGFHYSRGNNS